jgi:hypothetical protein
VKDTCLSEEKENGGADERVINLTGQKEFPLIFCCSQNNMTCIEGGLVIEIGILSMTIERRGL